MLHNYLTAEFGNRIRNIRRGLNLTQQDVADMSGINLDTLRKIENGYVVPRYDTLEILSITYKTDILDVFKNYRFTSHLYEIYNLLDTYIVEYHVDKLETIKNKIYNLDDEVNNTLVLASEINKLKKLVDAIYLLHSNNDNPTEHDLYKAKDMLIDALRIDNINFMLEDLEVYKYTYFDTRIFVILALIIRKLKESELSNKILFFILKIVDKSAHASFMEKLLVIKIYVNLSYNLYMMDNPEDTLKYSNEGIKFAQANSLMYGLPNLYWRKGIAELKLGLGEHLDSIKKSLYILDVQGNVKLKTIYEGVLKNKYNIIL